MGFDVDVSFVKVGSSVKSFRRRDAHEFGFEMFKGSLRDCAEFLFEFLFSCVDFAHDSVGCVFSSVKPSIRS